MYVLHAETLFLKKKFPGMQTGRNLLYKEENVSVTIPNNFLLLGSKICFCKVPVSASDVNLCLMINIPPAGNSIES